MGAADGDVGIPGVAGGDDRVQLPQDRRGDHGLLLRRGERVLFSGGQGGRRRRRGWPSGLPTPCATRPAAASVGPAW
jgi:hypothetical protein